MRILLVEDDPAMRRTLLDGLVAQGYHVDAVGNGEDAMHEINNTNYAVAVVDWRLPGISGGELVAWLRRTNRPTAVLAITARDNPEDRIQALDAGADDYLIKPFDLSEFLVCLQALARRPWPMAEPILTCGDLTLDSARHEVRVNKRPLALTATEYRVLKLLLRHGPIMVARRTLAEQAWGRGEGVLGAGAIDVQMSRLRAKIRGSGTRIITVRGAGYRLEPSL